MVQIQIIQRLTVYDIALHRWCINLYSYQAQYRMCFPPNLSKIDLHWQNFLQVDFGCVCVRFLISILQVTSVFSLMDSPWYYFEFHLPLSYNFIFSFNFYVDPTNSCFICSHYIFSNFLYFNSIIALHKTGCKIQCMYVCVSVH